jgi:hypothetical protein
VVLFVAASVKEIARLGTAYPWNKPSCCPRCGGRLWWHGFVVAWFSCFSHCVYLRRLFCSQCRAVHRLKPRGLSPGLAAFLIVSIFDVCSVRSAAPFRLKPQGYWPRYRSSSAEIQQAITHRQSTKRWRPDLPRSRQRQWWRRLGRMIRLVFGMSAQLTHREGFTRLIARNIIPVTQAIHHDNRHIHDPPYRIVALPGGL